MRWIKYILIYILALTVFSAFAQKDRKYIRQGNKEFEKADFENSEVSYRKAVDLEEKKTHEPAFNVGDALYKQEKYEDAINQFNSIADLEISKEAKAKIYHNLGNSLLQSNKYKESIEAYKNALRNIPGDMETKYNLAYAQKKLEEQEQQQNQNQDQNQESQDKQDKQDQDKKKDKQDQNKDENQEKDQQQQISKEDAERILQALANDEKDTQKKVKEQQAAAAKVKVEKEW
ncbi:MAG: tetratricopeptide repeat protein [Bacteroidales bacterium]|nr:tetratricopeptide repeat protein [Bacteroidales bacterium]